MLTENRSTAFDIIGDVHGHGDLLEKLLLKLDYTDNGLSFSHPERKAVFCGDFIDRGKENIKALNIVMQMCKHGQALAIPGNHDIAFIQYHTKRKGTNQYIIPKNPHHEIMFRETLREFNENLSFKESYLQWIKNLPLFIEHDLFRVYHGYYHPEIRKTLSSNGRIATYNDVLDHFENWSPMADLISKSISLKVSFQSNKGRATEKIRIKWWKPVESDLQPDHFLLHNYKHLSNVQIEETEVDAYQKFNPYEAHEKPLFLGHFCIHSTHGILASNLCIIDLCVIKTGRLAAYRFDGEKILKKEKIVIVQ
jgi:hypothetical protein